MKYIFRFIKKYFAVMVFMLLAGTIIYFSEQSGIKSGEHTNTYLEFINRFIDISSSGKTLDWFAYIGRKAAHITLYMLLFITSYFAIGSSSYFSTRKISIYMLSMLFGILFAISDEIHQAFIPGRNASAIDVLIDTIGLLIGWLMILIVERCFKKSNSKGI